MKDAFRIKKGLNIAPVDPVSVVNPEAGDLIIDSSDDNKLKVFDEASADWASVGSGGSSGNLMSDFEKLTPVVTNVVATVDTLTFLPIDDNNKSVKAVFSGSNGSIRYEVAAPADLDGVQGVVQLWIKTSVENLEVIATKDGVQYAGPLTVNSSNKWRQYEIPVVFSDADYGFEIKANGSAAGDVYIDEAFVKVQSIVSTVDIAMTDWQNYTPILQQSGGSPSVGNGVLEGRWRRVGQNVEITIRFKVGSTTNFGSGSFEFSLPSGLVADTSKMVAGVFATDIGYLAAGSVTMSDFSDVSNRTMGVFRYEQTSNTIGIFRIGGAAVGATSPFTWDVNDQISGSASIPIQGWSVETSTIVTQNTELTAQTANEFVATIAADGTVSGENFDWINGNCTNANPRVCTLNNINLSAAMTCVTGGGESVSASSTTSISITGNSSATTVNCTRSTDYRKSATIVGKFENINSSELVKVEAVKTTSQTLSNNIDTTINYDLIQVDNYNAYNPTTGVFTCPKESSYLVTANVHFQSLDDNSSSSQLIRMRSGATIYELARQVGLNTSARTRSISVSTLIRCESTSQTWVLEANSNNIDLTNSSTRASLDSTYFNRFSITELPDTQSIIKNLNDEQISKEVIRPNHIINGNFDFWQRGTSASLSSSSYVADRWVNIVEDGTSSNISRQSITQPSSSLFNAAFFHRIQVTSSNTSSSAYIIQQRIEDVTKLAGKTVTISFWAKADSSKNISLEMQQNFGTGGSPSAGVLGIGVQKFSISTSWQKITHTVTLPFINGKTLGTDGVQTTRTTLNIWLDAGSNNNSRTDSLGNQSGTFDIAQVKLEEGDTATPFVLAGGTIEGELAACQRYLQILNRGTLGRVTGTGIVAFFKQFNPVMRITPNIVINSGLFFVDNGSANASANPATLLSTTSSNSGARVFIGGFSGLTTGTIFPNDTEDKIYFDAEF
jgi:hypothetical protein